MTEAAQPVGVERPIVPLGKEENMPDNVELIEPLAHHHALNNPGHTVAVSYDVANLLVVEECQQCDWWNHQ